MAATELVQVQFHGDVLDCVQQDGKVWFSIRRGCENLELAVQGQLEKLKAKAWAVVKEIVMTGPDGKTYTMACIDLDSLPGWLFSIDARKVKEQSREKLARYQREAARVLADHFFRRPADPASRELIETFHGLLTQARAANAQLLARVESLESRLAMPAAVHIPTNATPRETVQTRLRFKGWHGTSAKQRAQIRRQANLWLDLRYNETPDVSGGPGGPLVYYGHQIGVLDEAIDTVREVYLRRDAAGGPKLFDQKRAA